MNDPHPHVLATGPTVPDALRRTRRAGASLLLLLLLAGALRLAFNLHDAQALQQRTREAGKRTVTVVHARPGQLKHGVVLPATLRGSSESPIYARSAGYLSAWYKTIGDHVQKGELLARIDAPEQEQELAQARATREQIRVRLNQARQTFERWSGLHALDSVSRQEVDDRRSARDQAAADFAAADANVRRLEQLEGFRRIVAPFAGVITRRSAEVGNLISSGGKELFAIAQTDPLRLTLWVPQAYASDIRNGQEVSVRLKEQPGREFAARVEHVAGAIDTATRSRQVDVVLPNAEGRLLPGAYAEVGITLVSGVSALVVPANVLQITPDGPRVVVVDGDGRLLFRFVRVGRDLGREVEILDGITAEDRLVGSPADVLVEGETVLVREMTSLKVAGAAPAKPATP